MQQHTHKENSDSTAENLLNNNHFQFFQIVETTKMGVDLALYRQRIGCNRYLHSSNTHNQTCNQEAVTKNSTKSSSLTITMTLHLLCIIIMLLTIGCIESNPGPSNNSFREV